eukprot:TRINITY_DN11380_c0_g9_i1.p1 TRINITY_DN11380_c0_g9~~TRINITY_DN11380_c0_g9_i1.p1  ORF type:complete len:419 (-),score=111.41 TRINITY_DN11380_c0_g9_i1:175-1431(-)
MNWVKREEEKARLESCSIRELRKQAQLRNVPLTHISAAVEKNDLIALVLRARPVLDHYDVSTGVKVHTAESIEQANRIAALRPVREKKKKDKKSKKKKRSSSSSSSSSRSRSQRRKGRKRSKSKEATKKDAAKKDASKKKSRSRSAGGGGAGAARRKAAAGAAGGAGVAATARGKGDRSPSLEVVPAPLAIASAAASSGSTGAAARAERKARAAAKAKGAQALAITDASAAAVDLDADEDEEVVAAASPPAAAVAAETPSSAGAAVAREDLEEPSQPNFAEAGMFAAAALGFNVAPKDVPKLPEAPNEFLRPSINKISSASPFGGSVLPGLRVCTQYLTNASCQLGSRCPDSHIIDPEEEMKIRARFKEQMCHNGASCKRPGCLYRHPGETYEPASFIPEGHQVTMRPTAQGMQVQYM